jgi:hypothetical protein
VTDGSGAHGAARNGLLANDPGKIRSPVARPVARPAGEAARGTPIGVSARGQIPHASAWRPGEVSVVLACPAKRLPRPARPGRQLNGAYPPPRQRREPRPQPQLIQEPERAGVHRVTPEVTQEVSVLVQDGNLDTRPGQQQGQNHSGRPAAHHATRCPLRHRPPVLPRRGQAADAGAPHHEQDQAAAAASPGELQARHQPRHGHQLMRALTRDPARDLGPAGGA